MLSFFVKDEWSFPFLTVAEINNVTSWGLSVLLSLGVDVVGIGRLSDCWSIDEFVGLLGDIGGAPNKLEIRSSRGVRRAVSSVEVLFAVVVGGSDSVKNRKKGFLSMKCG